ncbi:UDP-3-O-(3-hydroxymyristoyl)glucosamine N-acyltransferase [candidate division KSB1 bacterium]|nr:MAG: UDP-3-O-(3-hydroxymyristoyl)glucosamine N-acyltransferase [candidate division KSB1 bacterium]
MGIILGKIAEKVNGELIGDGQIVIEDVAKIEEAQKGTITFLANPKYLKYLETSGASAVIIGKDVEHTGEKPVIKADDPYFAFLQVVLMFHTEKIQIEPGVHKTAVVGRNVKLGKNTAIGANVFIGDNCTIGDNTIVMPGVVIEEDVVIGRDCLLRPLVSLRNGVRIGDRVVLHNGVVVGSDGFGFAFHQGIYHKIPQIGTVVIEDDVEIGANSTIDRATMGETRIKKGTKIDNLVQVAHNCIIGEHTVIAAQAGLSGSTKIGNYVRIGGQAGFAGHLSLGNNSAVMAQSGVSKSFPDNVTIFGYPAALSREEFRRQGALRKLPDLLKQFTELKKEVEELKKNQKKSD